MTRGFNFLKKQPLSNGLTLIPAPQQPAPVPHHHARKMPHPFLREQNGLDK